MPKRSPSIVYWLGNNLYLNVTNRCPNNCYFCVRNFKDGVSNFNLKLQKEPLVDEVIAELGNVINLRNWHEIVFCGFGEPLERLDCVLSISKWIKRNYGKIVKIRVNTNGQGFLLNEGRDVIAELRGAGVDRVSVSLNAHDEETYNQVCRPTFNNAFNSVLDFIMKAKELLEVEVTTVMIPEVDISKVRGIAEGIGVKFRVREYVQCSL